MTRSQLFWSGVLLSLALALTVAASACGVDDLNLTGHACPCGAGFVCDDTRNVCVTPAELAADGGDINAEGGADGGGPCLGDSCTCTTVADCKDPAFPKCTGGKCVECTTTPDSCSVGRYCLPTLECAPGCKSNSECAALSPSAPFCNLERHQCVNCALDTDCKGGQKCSPAGACVDACAGGTCTGSKQCCGGLCLDTSSDPLNCKLCGNACGGAQTLCCAGTCTDPLTTATSCGVCGLACSTANGTPSCFAGSCKWQCNQGFGHCANGNTGCETNTSTDIGNCGRCGRDCNQSVAHATGIACASGSCTFANCVQPYQNCDGQKSNGCEATSCGACGAQGQPCCAGNQCSAGNICSSNTNTCHGN